MDPSAISEKSKVGTIFKFQVATPSKKTMDIKPKITESIAKSSGSQPHCKNTEGPLLNK